MKPHRFHQDWNVRSTLGFTFLELVIATLILQVLTMLAVPLLSVTVKRERGRELRRYLWDMRDAIDRHKDAADSGVFQTQVDSHNYPPDLGKLVNGVDALGKKTRLLPRIPLDDDQEQRLGLRSMQGDPNSHSWGGQNVFDCLYQVGRNQTGRNTKDG